MKVRERGLMPTECEGVLRAGGEAALNVFDDLKVLVVDGTEE